MKITENVTTLADLREFVATCERLGVEPTARINARTRFSFSPDGPELCKLTVDSMVGPARDR